MLRKVAVAAASNPHVEIRQDGEKFYIKTFTSVRTTEINFHIGEEFDEETVDGRKCKVKASAPLRNTVRSVHSHFKLGFISAPSLWFRIAFELWKAASILLGSVGGKIFPLFRWLVSRSRLCRLLSFPLNFSPYGQILTS